MVNYGGDEVSALVVDIGSSSLRAGYAGDDTPKAIIPTSYGYIKAADDGDFAMADVNDAEIASKPKLAKSYIGQSGPSVWRSGMEVANPIKGGLINDFGPIHALIEHAVVNVMGCNPSEHPVLVTEPSWNTVENRERMAEIMFEEFQVPAFYISNTGVLNTFAAGKGSALVIDVGQEMASVTPVVDGFVLRKAAHTILTQPTHTRRGIDLSPHQLIANKLPVEPNNPPKYTLREDRLVGTTDSWRQWYEAREVDEWLQTVGGVLETGWNDQAAASRAPRQYEFPTGYNTWFGAERYYVGEQFFIHSPQMSASNHSLPKTIPALISESLRSYDIELRQVLMGNVVLTGGGSLFSGFNDRLASELSRTFPHVKIHAPGNPIERRYGGWLGGSILASLGTFHQLWISKEEWQEHGKGIVAQRCK
ncbi:actin-related protein Arp4p [Armillaria luteobubalina]|uniref:Actin-related protein Arp4p n=1 Tax=Armillaria luteobubalina TaxID=153913 RepID=A0AA39Q930_9AGAR|nr:actin-related protein Arp4p [Armillaria luteobubalina]